MRSHARGEGGCSSGKRGFSSRAKARKHVRGHGPSKTVYLCPKCGLWHLTSQRSRRRRA